MVREPDATMQPTLQDNQLMSKHHVLSLKPHLRLKWRGQRGQDETEKSDHLGDSIASGFSVHTVAACRTWSYNPRWTAAAVQEHVIAFEQTRCLGGTSH
jgi:hypothetical protein